MEEYPQNIELFDKYLRSELSQEEKAGFEKRLKDDPDFQNEFNLYLDIVTGIKAAAEDHLRDKFKEIDRKEESLLSGKRLSTYLSLAAAIVLFIVVGISVLIKIQQNKKHDAFIAKEKNTIINDTAGTDTSKTREKNVYPESIEASENKLLAMNVVKEYYTQYPNKIFPRSRGEIPTDSFELAMYYYDLQDYSNAESILKHLTYNQDAVFYYALTLLALDKNKSAWGLLLETSRNKISKFYYPSIWYAGMALLKMNNIDQAIVQFEKLVQEKNPYSESAITILNILKK